MSETDIITCSICYEEFNDGNDEETAGSDLDIGISLKCETLKCDSLICNGCQIKLQKQIGKNNIIKCAFCRQIQFKNHFTWNVLKEDLYLWKEKQKRKLGFGIHCNEELINGIKNMIEITNKQLEDLTEKMEKIQREMNEKIEKLAIYD